MRDAQIVPATFLAVSLHTLVLTHAAAAALDTPAPLTIMVAPARPVRALLTLSLGPCLGLFARASHDAHYHPH